MKAKMSLILYIFLLVYIYIYLEIFFFCLRRALIQIQSDETKLRISFSSDVTNNYDSDLNLYVSFD